MVAIDLPGIHGENIGRGPIDIDIAPGSVTRLNGLSDRFAFCISL